jgi:transcriptional regulator with XRE-family HTH domain
MRDDQVFMGTTLCDSIEPRQWESVTATRDNRRMVARTLAHPPETYGERVTYWREDKGWTRSKLATKAKVPYQSLVTIETTAQSSSKHSARIAAALGINLHYLDTGEGDPKAVNVIPAPADAASILTAKVSPDDLDTVMQDELMLEVIQFRIKAVVETILKKKKPARSRKTGTSG